MKRKINIILTKFSVNKWDVLHSLNVASLDGLAVRLGWSEIVEAIVYGGVYRASAIRELYSDILGREADTGGLSSHVIGYAAGGWRHCVEGFLESEEYWAGKGGGNARSFLSAAWRDVAGSDDLADLDQLASALDRGGVSRRAAVAELVARPAVAERQSRRLWSLLTGRSDPAPAPVVDAFETGGREAAILVICESPEFSSHAVESAADPYLPPISPVAGVHEIDVYRSYNEADLALLAEFAAPSPQPRDGYFTDFLGRITDCRFVPGIESLDGKVRAHIPVPSDGFYAETIEYLGLLTAFKTLTRDAFVCAEFGAGWGPWAAAAGVIARARGVARFGAVAVEASIEKIGLVRQHLADNGLQPDSASCRCVHGAIWTSDGEVQFPSVPVHDHSGAAAETAPAEFDYRGSAAAHVPVPAYTVETLLGDHDIVDFIHIDIQGAEADVCEKSIEFLKDRVRYLFIATHSRTIEGRLIELFRSNGFDILREKPCRFGFDHWPGSLEGITTADGGQLWRNPKFVTRA